MIPNGRKFVADDLAHGWNKSSQKSTIEDEMVPNGWNTSFVRSMVDDNALPGRLISYVTFQSRWKKGKFDGVIPDG